MDFRVPVMIFNAWPSWMSTFGQCELQPQTEAQ